MADAFVLFFNVLPLYLYMVILKSVMYIRVQNFTQFVENE